MKCFIIYHVVCTLCFASPKRLENITDAHKRLLALNKCALWSFESRFWSFLVIIALLVRSCILLWNPWIEFHDKTQKSTNMRSNWKYHVIFIEYYAVAPPLFNICLWQCSTYLVLLLIQDFNTAKSVFRLDSNQGRSTIGLLLPQYGAPSVSNVALTAKLAN